MKKGESYVQLVDICTRNFQPMNVPRKLTSIRQRLCELIKRVTKFKRNAATHVFVFMISSELRDRKPFAIPIQCIPYKGLGEENIRTLTRAVITDSWNENFRYYSSCYVYMHITLIIQGLSPTENSTISGPRDILGHFLYCNSVLIFATGMQGSTTELF